jgi:DNA-binding transcriptional MerR regulator
MPETQDASHLSIGEVLGLLLEEFPDVTISKIRFLESQGLIAPERTPSGYRKFYEHDIDLLRVILREQRENYLPLRVIKDRLHSGAIDPSGEVVKPAGSMLDGDGTDVDEHHEPAEVPAASIRSHPASRRASTDGVESDTDGAEPESADRADHTPVTPQLLPGVVLDRSELCAMIGMSPNELAELESFGIVSSRSSGGATLYNDDAVEIAKVAVEFLRAGVDARHLRSWRTAAEREASLYEQLITPRLRQRNPESRAEALEQLRRLDVLGAKLRHALMRTTLRHHFET